MEGKKYIILVGGDAVSYFTGISVDHANGFDISELSFPFEDMQNKKVFAMVSPNTLFRAYGEVRFACEKLKEFLNE